MNETPAETEAACDGWCVWATDLGVLAGGVAYPHPGCPLHAPDEAYDHSRCVCGGESL